MISKDLTFYHVDANVMAIGTGTAKLFLSSLLFFAKFFARFA
jgi:hypothetical protein